MKTGNAAYVRNLSLIHKHYSIYRALHIFSSQTKGKNRKVRTRDEVRGCKAQYGLRLNACNGFNSGRPIRSTIYNFKGESTTSLVRVIMRGMATNLVS